MPAGIPIELDSPVTTIIIQRPFNHRKEAYEEWLREIVPLAQSASGHRGVNIIRPHGTSDAYTIVLHFSSEANLRNWLESETRRGLLEKVRPLLNTDETIEVKTGLEYWFTPPGSSSKTAPASRQFLITLSAIYPLSMLVSWLLTPVFSAIPLLSSLFVRALLTSTVIVGLMTFVIMPRYVRLVSAWLFR